MIYSKGGILITRDAFIFGFEIPVYGKTMPVALGMGKSSQALQKSAFSTYLIGLCGSCLFFDRTLMSGNVK